MRSEGSQCATGADRLDAFRTVVSDTFVPLEASTAAVESFHGRVTTQSVGAVHASTVEASAMLVRRTPRLIAAGDPEFYKLGLQLRGYCVVSQDGREAGLRPGDFAIYDTSRPYHISADEAFCTFVVMFPRKLLRLPAEGMAMLTARRVCGQQSFGALVAGFLTELRSQLDSPDPAVGVHLGDAVLDLLAAAFGKQLHAEGRLAPETRRRALLLTIRSFIEEHLGDPELDLDTIARAHNVSTSYLQKLFAADGHSVSGWIRERRLEQCRRDLGDPLLSDRSVSAIGSCWGLTNGAHLSRLFKSAYGMTPRDYRRVATTTIR